MTEQQPIPTLAKSAIALARDEFQRTVDRLGSETLDVMRKAGDISGDGWYVDFTAGVATREVSDGAEGLGR